MALTLRQHLDGRMEGLKQDRNSYWTHWQELANYILPRRYKWLVTPNQATRGSPINSSIIDSTGTIAMRKLAAGVFAGTTNPVRKWLKLKAGQWSSDESDAVSRWLAEVKERMLDVFSGSNFYDSMSVLHEDLSGFATGCMVIYEDAEDVICCKNFSLGEFYFGVGAKNKVNVVYAEYTKTVAALVEEFGLENCSDAVKRAHERGGEELQREVVVNQAIEPNTEISGRPPTKFKWREIYWEKDSAKSPTGEDLFLRKTGFVEWPAATARWAVEGNAAYGRGPSMDALGDIKQLQQETKRKAQAIDKLANPPMLADLQLKNQPASLLPGGVSYIASLGTNNVGMKPAYQVQPPIAEFMQDIREIQMRIREIFFNDLFMAISQLETVRTATEIDGRREEKLIMLGPVIHRFDREVLDMVVDRTFAIMSRRGLLPPPPRELQGLTIKPQYISILREAIKGVSLTGIERLLATTGGLMAVDQTVMDNIDLDETITEYADILDVPPKLIRGTEAVAQLRAQRAQQIAQAQAKQDAMAAVQGAEVLSKTDVGGGTSALSAMLGA